MDPKIKQAYNVAKNDLRACYGKQGINAGLNHFKDYWARDAFFASFGSLELKDYEIVKINLESFLTNISKKGQVPIRIGRSTIDIIKHIFGLKTKNKLIPLYRNDKTKHPSLDQNSLLLILLYEYTQKSKDKSLFLKYKLLVKHIIEWLISHDFDDDYLIEEGLYANWADSIKKRGKVLYTNVCYARALFCISELFKTSDKNLSKKYFKIYKNVKIKINELFWNGEHYIDWINDDKHYNYFSTDGNVLSILWDISDNKKSKHIEEASHIYDINDIPSQCVHPNYPFSYVNNAIKLIGLKDYHNGLSWLWLGSINAIAKHKLGMSIEANKLLINMSNIINKYGHVYEVYEKTGKPVKRIFYKAEYPFAWSSGLFIYAVSKIHENVDKQ